MITGVVERLRDGHDLGRDDAHAVMGVVMAGEASDTEIAELLVALRDKGETAEEIAGFADAMREHVVPVRPRRSATVQPFPRE